VEKLHKIADWMMRNKELVVLVLLLATLLYRGYTLMNPKELPPLTMGAMARTPDEDILFDRPPPLPLPPEAIPLDGLNKANPFTTRTPREQVRNPSDTVRPDLKLQSIQKFKDGSYKAQIATKAGVRARWYKEAEQFESYRVEKIDAENESVTVYSEEHRKKFEYKVER
jgi:hypothetical protein